MNKVCFDLEQILKEVCQIYGISVSLNSDYKQMEERSKNRNEKKVCKIICKELHTSTQILFVCLIEND